MTKVKKSANNKTRKGPSIAVTKIITCSSKKIEIIIIIIGYIRGAMFVEAKNLRCKMVNGSAPKIVSIMFALSAGLNLNLITLAYTH